MVRDRPWPPDHISLLPETRSTSPARTAFPPEPGVWAHCHGGALPRKAPAGDEACQPSLVRCAIYTRTSSEEGLEQSFNSLDAQREAGEAYIASQRHQGWMTLPDRYDDGGYTGGHMERPALQRLLADISHVSIDCVVLERFGPRGFLNAASLDAIHSSMDAV
jgi:Resolvase, N terminal domain